MDIAFQENAGGCGSCSRQAGGAKKKRALSAYNIFMKKEMALVKKLHPKMTAVECMKMAAKKWKASTAHASAKSKSRKATKPVKKASKSSSQRSRSPSR
jgi:hypothetical protein